ncbi:MAG: hypothetical protein Q9202_004535 [Teloschistes flavicans]
MPNPFRILWHKWKALPLPWRKRWLAGTDLAGNYYHYFRPALGQRPRRIFTPSTHTQFSDVHIPPQWHQWLRYTRPHPPSVQELQLDVQRQIELKKLAAAADARWASKPSVLDAPRRRNQELGVGDGEGGVGAVGRRGESVGAIEEGRKNGEKLGEGVKGEDVGDSWGEGEKGREKNPWIRERPKNPGEGWQPESWQPPGVTR